MSNTATIKQQLVGLLNDSILAQQGIEADFNVESVSFGEPSLYAPGVLDLDAPTARNTVLPITPLMEGEPEEGVAPVVYNLHYNRLFVPRLIDNAGIEIEGTGEEVSTHDVLALLNATLGVQFEASDLDDELIEEVSETERTVTVRAAADSLGYFGEGTITLLVPAPEVEEPPVEEGDGA